MAAKKKRVRKHRHAIAPTAKPTCAISPKLHAAIINRMMDGDWPAMVALACGVSPNTLMNWVIKGLDPTAHDGYRAFADEFVAIEVDLSSRLVKVIMDSSLGQGEAREEGSSAPNVSDAKWLLTRRFSFLWAMDKDTLRTRGQSAAELVCTRIEEIESEDREKVRKILAQLPDDAKRDARGAGFLVP